MDKIQEKAYFNIGNSEYYEGYHIKDERWNGWARPYFEKCIAELFVNNFATRDFQIVYDKYTDCYICKTLENDIVTFYGKYDGLYSYEYSREKNHKYKRRSKKSI